MGWFPSSNTVIHDVVFQHYLLPLSTLNLMFGFKWTKQIFCTSLEVKPIHKTFFIKSSVVSSHSSSMSQSSSVFKLSIGIVSSGSICASPVWAKCFLCILWQAFCAYLYHRVFQIHLTDAYVCFSVGFLWAGTLSSSSLNPQKLTQSGHVELWIVSSRHALHTQNVCMYGFPCALCFRWALCTYFL